MLPLIDFFISIAPNTYGTGVFANMIQIINGEMSQLKRLPGSSKFAAITLWNAKHQPRKGD